MNKITLSLSLNEAKILYKEATLDRKSELEEFFPELKPTTIIDRVKSYEDALRELGKEDFSRENLYPREIARRRLEIIVEALNEGWKPDLSNYQEYKWFCYFSWSITGFGYSYSYYSPTAVNAFFGIHFCLKSEELADYIGHQFLYLYKEMLLG